MERKNIKIFNSFFPIFLDFLKLKASHTTLNTLVQVSGWKKKKKIFKIYHTNFINRYHLSILESRNFEFSKTMRRFDVLQIHGRHFTFLFKPFTCSSRIIVGYALKKACNIVSLLFLIRQYFRIWSCMLQNHHTQNKIKGEKSNRDVLDLCKNQNILVNKTLRCQKSIKKSVSLVDIHDHDGFSQGGLFFTIINFKPMKDNPADHSCKPNFQ